MMAVLFSASIMGFSQITHNLVLDMDFQSGVVDSSSQNQAATAMGTVLYGSDQWNMANSCLQLAGGSNPDGIEFTGTTGAYRVSYPATISAWVKLNAYNSVSSQIVATDQHVANLSGLWMEITAQGAVSASYGNGTAAGSTARFTYTTANNVIDLNNWHHIVAVYRDNVFTDIYVDGFLVPSTASGNLSSCVYLNTLGGKIGSFKKGSTASRPIDGMIDKVKIYDTTLTNNEILHLFYTGHNNKTTLLLNYNMNNNYNDISINQRMSAQIGSCVYENDRASNANYALNTSATSGIEIQEANGNFKCNFPITFSTWMRLDGVGTVSSIFTNDDNASNYTGFYVQLTAAGNIFVSVGDGTGSGGGSRRSYMSTFPFPTDGLFHHLAVVCKPTSGSQQFTTQIYVDGVSQVIGTQTGTGNALHYNTTGANYAKIGAFNKGSATVTTLNGALDDVMFWNDSLTSSKVINLFNNYSSVLPNSINIKENTILKNSATLFPNPTNGIFTIEAGNESINEITVIDVTGKVIVVETNLNDKNYTLDLSSYPKGFYIVKTNCEQKQSVNKLIIN